VSPDRARLRHPHPVQTLKRDRDPLPALPSRAVIGALIRPECHLPKPDCLSPSSRLLLPDPSVGRRPGCLPPLFVAEFEQSVLYGCGPAQVGFDVNVIFSFLFISSVFSPMLDLAAGRCGSRTPLGLDVFFCPAPGVANATPGCVTESLWDSKYRYPVSCCNFLD
jgi:hypothetical protein